MPSAYPSVSLAKDLRASVESGHPWVFDQALRKPPKQMQAGDLITLTHGGAPLAIGLIDPGCQILVRILTLDCEARIDAAWVRERARLAAALRSGDPRLAATNAFRVIHGENDFMPGLVLDLYNGTGVMSFDGAAAKEFWTPHAAAVVEACREAGVAMKRLWARPPRKTGGRGVLLHGDEPEQIITIEEHGARFEVDVRRGQKTGFFLDQRENRRRVATLSAGGSVLNLYGYTGGFSVHAALAGATHVATVDIAAPAIEAAKRNFTLNAIPTQAHEFIAADVHEYLRQPGGDPFDIVIADPPSFAPNKRSRGKALGAYRRVNEAAMRRVRTGGTLISASCSSHINADDMLDVVAAASSACGRAARVQEIFGAGSDHPVRPGFVEGRYLDLLIVHVD